MLSPRLNNCPECANIPSLLKKIDCKLAELGNNLYNNISYMLNKPIPAGDILQLITYRRILTYKYCNPNYVHEYTVQMIASRVIRLTLGCVSRCNEPERCLEDPCEIDIVANPTTTSTTTLTTCQSYILYNTAPSAESFLIGNCDTGEPETITLEGLSSVCIQTFVGLNVSANIVVIETDSCTTSTTSSTSTSTSSTSSTTTSTSTTAVPTTTTTSSSSTSTTTTTTTAYVLACTAGYTGPVGFPNRTTGIGSMTLGSGLVVSTTYTGPSPLATGLQPPFTNCAGGQFGGNVGIGGSISLNRDAGAFTFTITYSAPQNAVKFVLDSIGYATELGVSEYYTITTDSTNTLVKLIAGCGDFRVEAPNVVAGSMSNPATRIGGNVEVIADTPFTTVTITGNNSPSLAGTIWDMYVCDGEVTTTTTTSSSSSTTTTTTTTLAPTSFNTIYTRFEALP